MDIDRNKAFKLLIVIIATIAALAVMSTVIQIIQATLPFLIIGGGIFWAYRWAFSDAPAPSSDEVEQQARSWFRRFRRAKKAAETTVAAGAALDEMTGASERRSRRRAGRVVSGEATKARTATAPEGEAAAQNEAKDGQKAAKARQAKTALKSNPGGAIEFKDSEVIVSADDIDMPDLSRLQEKEREEPQVNDNVMSQIEERRRRLQGGG